MSTDITKHPYKKRQYDIVSYDLNWPKQFEIYASKIRKVFGDEIRIEHIGSTSVPGMSGKPSIDLLVMTKDIETIEEYVEKMKSEGFEYTGSFVTKDSRLFRVMDDDTVLANIHFFPNGHSHNKEMLNLRDYLRSHSEEVKAYSELKDDLYSRYSDDYASYRKYKDEYMEALKARVVLEIKE